MAFAEKLISGGGLAFAAVGALAWQFATRQPPIHVALGIDPSGSVERNCQGLRKEAEALLRMEGIRQGSTMTALVMGRNKANPEPARALDEPIPLPPSDITGRKKNEEAFRRAQVKLLDAVAGACENAPESPQSPIFQLAKTSLAHLKSRGCGPSGRCYLLIKTDGVESVEPRLSRLIERSAKTPLLEIPADLTGALDNSGVTVTFCGGAELRTRRNAAAAPEPEALERIWKAIFTEPANVFFRPYCGQ